MFSIDGRSGMIAWSSRTSTRERTPTSSSLPSPVGMRISGVIVVRRGNPRHSMATNGMRGFLLSVFSTVTFAFSAPSFCDMPVSSEKENSGTRQPRQRTRPISQVGAFGMGSGVAAVMISDTFAFGSSTRPFVIVIISPRISRGFSLMYFPRVLRA